jgi:hypothetical protein
VQHKLVAVSKLKRLPFYGAAELSRCCRSSQFRLVLALISALLWSGCTRAANSTAAPTVVFEAMPQPTRVGAVTVDFTLTDAAAMPVVGAHLTAEADMTHAGMSPVFGAVEEKQPGHYESTLKLEMAGDWVILLHGALPTGDKLERQFELRNVQPTVVLPN